MSASGLYTIDGFDFYDQFGYAVNSASDQLLQLPEAEEPYSYRWKNEGITEYDLSSPTFLDKLVTFTGHIIANDKSDFWAKYLAVWEVLKAPGARLIYSSELEQQFHAFYRKATNVERFSRLQGFPDKIAVRIDITFMVMFSQFVQPGGKLNQSILFGAIPAKVIGDPDFNLEATASSGLPVTFISSNPSVATISGNKVHIGGIGTSTITAIQSGNDEFNPATPVQRTLTVTALNNGFPYTFPYNLG